ncbi:TetR family transcriptional regulator [Actinocatenispora thailandica]|uniref:TetR family transcriptional regulator n=1 Tax=Actinocatenispora thailandica TaxID=227318 RepID=A0A7R7HZZ7_9ACTN|nr:TetR/AcrR family transcriptional regulator [Actinocatenispora thailandica]BCJ38793.1 TetR family transcriptional regulator [Actinocatenispora thailandica]
MTRTTRDLLLDAAEQLLDAGGVEAVTLREVGRRSGVSHNAPYKHFANKEALLAAIAARELRRRRDRLTTALAGAEPPEQVLRRSLRRYAEWAQEYPARFKLIYGRWTTHSDELAEAAHAASAQLLTAVRAAQAGGALPPGDPERLLALLRALAHGAADLELAGHLAPDGKGHADAPTLIDDLLTYLHPS